jgi:hypothetical protein
MTDHYIAFQKLELIRINHLFLDFNFELVLYDESEYFKPHDDPEFNYPWIPRKTLIESSKFNIDDIQSPDEYEYLFQDIKMIKSEVCLEGSFMDQINFFGQLYYNFRDFLLGLIGALEEEETDNVDIAKDSCENTFFRKQKYLSGTSEIRKF